MKYKEFSLLSTIKELRPKRRSRVSRRAVTAPTKSIPKFIPNPAYEGSDEQKEEAFAMSRDLEDYYTMMPGECGAKIPEGGAWIMVKISPCTEYTVPQLSMWYAVEEVKAVGSDGLYRHKASILTPKGSLCLWPGEYVVVKDITPYLSMPEDHVRIHLLGGDAINPDKLFYIRSRGISKADAIKMLLGEVKTQDVAFITVHPAYADILCCPNHAALPERLAFTEEWP